MQDLVSQARKEGMISTGIDLFLAAVPATLVALDIAINGMLGLSTNGYLYHWRNYFCSFVCFGIFQAKSAPQNFNA
ncbi:hypothetical protein [uncultured Campylobacter sp.]|uniref:hypothetical protein n=1 Tax=uncultured Campylobacter sp. TaxID=218934 RepID=UPI00262381B3|nr:hypothetical protein [uncultured Campylobacter sp.]